MRAGCCASPAATLTAHERRSTTRYVADITYMFNPDAVARLLRAASIAYSQAPAHRILVIPMSPGVGHGPLGQCADVARLP